MRRGVLTLRGLLLALALLAPLPAAAQQGPVEVLLEACTAPDLPLAVRFDRLNAAGWRHAADTRQTRALHALVVMARFPALFRGVDPTHVARLGEAMDSPVALSAPGGAPLSVEGLAEALASRGPSPDLMLAHPDLGALARLQLGGSAERLGIACLVGLAQPWGEAAREALVASRQPLAGSGPSDADATEQMRTFTRLQAPDAPLRIVVLDIGPGSTLHGVTAAAGSPVTLSTRIETLTGYVTLR